MEVNRPRATQKSRKGKKSWRKNVNIDDVEEGLQDVRDKKIIMGDEYDNDFIIDTTGDDKLRSKNTKTLKSREILTNKSKVAPLLVERNNKKTIQGVHKTEIHRLMRLSGKVQGESKMYARIEKDGIANVDSKDIWGEAEEDNRPEFLKNRSDKEVTKASRVPETLKHKPIRIAQKEDTVDAGKSYNPSLESWKSLINKEYSGEYERELQRQAIIDHQEKIKRLIADLDNDEEASDSEENVSDKEADAENDDFKLSINQPTQVKIKTKAIRNKELKHKKRLELEDKLKELKEQVKELEKLDDINEVVKEKLSNTKTKLEKAPKKLFKYNTIQKPLEVKLSDELTSNLKDLKPEGNLLYDQMLNLQTSGKVETRIPVAKRRKYTPKITEKWTYKDFK